MCFSYPPARSFGGCCSSFGWPPPHDASLWSYLQGPRPLRASTLCAPRAARSRRFAARTEHGSHCSFASRSLSSSRWNPSSATWRRSMRRTDWCCTRNVPAHDRSRVSTDSVYTSSPPLGCRAVALCALARLRCAARPWPRGYAAQRLCSLARGGPRSKVSGRALPGLCVLRG